MKIIIIALGIFTILFAAFTDIDLGGNLGESKPRSKLTPIKDGYMLQISDNRDSLGQWMAANPEYQVVSISTSNDFYAWYFVIKSQPNSEKADNED